MANAKCPPALRNFLFLELFIGPPPRRAETLSASDGLWRAYRRRRPPPPRGTGRALPPSMFCKPFGFYCWLLTFFASKSTGSLKSIPMTETEMATLDEQGYVVLENFMGEDLLGQVRARVDELFTEEGEAAGSEFKQEPSARRLANLVNKGDVFQRVVAMPKILDCVRHVLGRQFKLSSLNLRSANPHSDWVQPLHADVGAIADEKGYWVCNSVWILDDFTPQNGAIRMVPGSHRWRKLPQDVLSDPVAPHPNEILLTGRAGTVVIMNAHMWHGATA